jgi:hypothetical protein
VKRRKRGDHDRDFIVTITDKHGATVPSRIMVGKFWAMSEQEAIDVAKKTYPGLFAKMETGTWIARAEEDFTPVLK